MQVTTNDTFASRRATIGRWCTILGFVVLIGGMYISLRQPQNPNPDQLTLVLLGPWLTLIAGIILLNVGKQHSMRWGTNPRVDRALGKALKGLDHRCHLYNFVPGLPAEHVLITPQGVVVFEPRAFIGEVIHKGTSWKRPMNPQGLLQRFADGGLGNPTREALRDAAAMRETLRERLGEESAEAITVYPMVVLTNSRVKIELTDPEVPVLMLADVRAGIRQLRDGQKLPTDIQRRLARALQWEPSQPALSTTRSNT